MRILNLIMILICIPLVLVGCIIRTLYPIYDKNNIILTDILSGSWVKKSDAKEWVELWQFVYEEDGLYNLSLITKYGINNQIEIDTAYFEAVVCDVNKHKYLDLTPDYKQIFKADLSNRFDCAFLIPSHTFLKFEISGNQLYLYIPSFDAIENILAKGSYNLSYKKLGKNDYIITADTKELQKFISDDEIHPIIFKAEPQVLFKK